MPRRTFNSAFWAQRESLAVPTRHGVLRAVVIRPPTTSLTHGAALPPVIMQIHGGGFLNRYPEQDRHLARYLAADLGAVVVLPDYSTAPKVRYPIAEEEAYDVARWVQRSGEANGWDGTRLLLSGISAGSKLALNVCQQIHTDGGLRPLAVSLIVPVTERSRTDRTSAIPRPAISPFVQRLVSWAYFPDAGRRREPLAAPRHDPSLPEAMPPTLIQTGEHDTLGAEGRELAQVLRDGGVHTLHQEYPQADHGFYSTKPVARVKEVLTQISTFFAAHLASGPAGND